MFCIGDVRILTWMNFDSSKSSQAQLVKRLKKTTEDKIISASDSPLGEPASEAAFAYAYAA